MSNIEPIHEKQISSDGAYLSLGLLRIICCLECCGALACFTP
jgi:hypothetical protein